MKTCKWDTSQIHKLVEGELDSREHSELTEHLKSCSHCSEILAEVSSMRDDIKTSLDSKIQLRDVELVARRAAEMEPTRHFRRAATGFLKKAALGTAICLVVVAVCGALSAYFYFGRTFPSEVTDMVLRCSDGIETKDSNGNWLRLKVADRLKRGMEIRTPEGTSSFVSFNGIRLLSEGRAEIEIEGSHSFTFKNGDVAIESSQGKRLLNILLGEASLETSGSTLKLSGLNNSFSVDCIAGTAALKTRKGNNEKHLVPGQRAMLSGATIEIASAQTEDPFAFRKVSVLERTKKRFNMVMARYASRQRTQFGRFEPEADSRRLGEGIQFASYAGEGGLDLVRNDSKRYDSDYYESLFAPSNRALSIGRQRLVPLTPGYAAIFPKWSHDGSMLAYIEHKPGNPPTTVARVVRLDDLDNSWDISQGHDTVLPMLPLTWAPDNRHVLFMVGDHFDPNRGWRGPYTIKIAPIDPAEGPLQDFDSPFYDIPLPLPVPVGKTISPDIYKLPWGDAMMPVNWGNIAYIPVEENGQSVPNAPGFFITNFNPREAFVMGHSLSPSGNMIEFAAVTDIVDFNPLNIYILNGVDDILDGFTEPPRSLDDPRIKQIAPTDSSQFAGGFSFDESLAFFHEDVNNAFDAKSPTNIFNSNFDVFYASAVQGDSGRPTQIHLPGNQLFLEPSPEGNRIVYCNYIGMKGELRLVGFEIEAAVDVDLGGVLIDNSGTNLIIPPGTLDRDFSVKISTPFDIGDEAEFAEGDNTFFAMRLIDAQGLENPRFIEPMTLTIRYTDGELKELDEGMLEIYYYDESDPEYPEWVPLGGVVDPEHNEITVEIQHFSKFAVVGKMK